MVIVQIFSSTFLIFLTWLIICKTKKINEHEAYCWENLVLKETDVVSDAVKETVRTEMK